MLMGNVVTNACAKFNYYRFHIDKAVWNFREKNFEN